MYKQHNTIITERKIRFALVGYGRIAHNHLLALKNYSTDCELTAICELDSARRELAAQKAEVKVYEDINKMLQAGGFDIVVLTTPSGLHYFQTILCAEAGYHVVTEKPMATTYSDGKRMVKACDRAGVKLFVVKQNRQNRTIKLLKSAINHGRLGKIYTVACNVFWNRPQEYYDTASWRGTWEFDGGAFMNQASHYVDLLEWLIGPVESVQAYIATLARNIEVEDSGVVALKWRNGALGTMNVSMLTYPKNLEGSITIIAEKATIKIGGVALNQIEHWEFAEPLTEDLNAKDANYQTSTVYGIGHQVYYENIIKTMRGEEDPHTDGRDGLKSLELLIAIYISARDGKKVSLPLNY